MRGALCSFGRGLWSLSKREGDTRGNVFSGLDCFFPMCYNNQSALNLKGCLSGPVSQGVMNEKSPGVRMMLRTLETDDFIVKFKDTPQLRDQVFERVLGFFTEHEAFHGESILQSDAPQLKAPCFFAELADELFKFDAEVKEV